MEQQQKIELIRKGNAAYNQGNMELAAKIFKATDYKDGLIRLGDYYYFEQHKPLLAYGFYRQANYEKMLDRIFEGFQFALQVWLHEDELGTESAGTEREQSSDSASESSSS